MFNNDDYNDNLGYCEYVFNKNEELDLNLKSAQEIQFVANNYLDEVYARGIADGEEVYENDKILLEVVNKLEKKFRKFKIVNDKPIKDKVDEYFEEKKLDENLREKHQEEKRLNSKGGHLYTENYDDLEIDELTR